MNARLISLAAFALALVGVVASFILTTVARGSLPDALIVGGSSMVALAIVAGIGGWRSLGRMRSHNRRALALGLSGGALVFWAAPLLALSQRASDAPSGADTLFFTTSLWGVLAVLGAYALANKRPALTGIAGAVCSAVGAAGLLASWEYPSSFSPFAKYPLREALMVVAGMLFAAGAIALAEAARTMGGRDAVMLALGAAAVLGVLTSLPGIPGVLSEGVNAWTPTVYLGVATAVFAGGWTWIAAHAGAARASVPLLLAPVGMTALAVYERATAAYGPNPFEIRGVLAGSAIVVMGAAVVWLSTAERDGAAAVQGRTAVAAAWVAVGSCVLAIVSLGMPALDALSEGHITDSFRVEWTMLGFESAAGWLPIAAALLALTAVLEARKGEVARTWVVASAAVLGCALAMPFLSATTLHTWNSWIPAEVQQTYGTEYARISFTAITDPVRVAAMVLAVLAAVMLGWSAAADKRIGSSLEEGSS